DQDGAVEIVEDLLQTQTLAEVYDAVLVPALYYAKQDQQHRNLTPEEAHFIYRVTHDLVEDLGTSQAAMAADTLPVVPEQDATTALLPKVRILACPAHDEADEVALRMLQQALDPMRYELNITKAALLTAEVIALVEQTSPAC